MPAGPPDVYSLDEIARGRIRGPGRGGGAVSRGRLRLVPGTRLVAEADAVRRGARPCGTRRCSRSQPAGARRSSRLARHGRGAMPRPGPWSLAMHVDGDRRRSWALGRAAAPAAATNAPTDAASCSWSMPGRAAAAGAAAARAPAARRRAVLERSDSRQVPQAVIGARDVDEAGRRRPSLSRSPRPSSRCMAPVAQVAAAAAASGAARLSAKPSTVASAGPGDGAARARDGTAATGRDAATASATATGGGTGGGPYRPGSGVEPPRLLHEVKAIYTEEARRANITGDVLMEVVVRARRHRGLGARDCAASATASTSARPRRCGSGGSPRRAGSACRWTSWSKWRWSSTCDDPMDAGWYADGLAIAARWRPWLVAARVEAAPRGAAALGRACRGARRGHRRTADTSFAGAGPASLRGARAVVTGDLRRRRRRRSRGAGG